MESKDGQIIEYLEKDINLTPESIELRSLNSFVDESEFCVTSATAPIKSSTAVYVEGIEIPIIQVNAIHVGKMLDNRFEQIFIDDDLVNGTVSPVFDHDSPSQTTMIVNLDSDNTIVLYRGYFRRVSVILSIMILVFFVITIAYITIFPPK